MILTGMRDDLVLDEAQTTGALWLAARTRAYLADAPGIPGKTPQVCVAARLVGVKRPLVICPAIAREMWHRHLREWAGIESGVVLSYNQLVNRGPYAAAMLQGYDLLVLDEVHMCKERDAMRTKLALTLANRAPRVWVLSGTPMPTSVLDLYPVLRAIWPDELRRVNAFTWDAYVEHFATVVPQKVRGRVVGIKVVANRNPDDMKAILGRIMLRRTSSAGLPALRWESYYLPWIDGSAAVDAEAERLGLTPESWDEALPQGGHLSSLRAMLGRLKAPIVAEHLSAELDAGAYEKIVVLAWHHDVLDVLQETLAPFCVERVDGTTSPAKKEHAMLAFQTNDKTRVFLGQIVTCSLAITLTAAHEVALVEQSWTPDENFQAAKRIHRRGQSQPCRARSFYAACRLDEAVARVHAGKIGRRNELIVEAQ